MMNQKSKFDEKWKLIRGESVADDKLDKFMTILQVKYGYTRQQARAEINSRWAFHQAKSRIIA